MSRYLSTLLIALFLLTGCSSKTVNPPAEEGNPKSHVKPFEYEYDYIIHALYYKDHGKYANAYVLFEELYKKTENLEYKIEALKLLIGMQQYEEAYRQLTTLLKRYPKNAELYRLLAVTDLKLKKVDEALESAKKALALEPDNIQDIDLVASIYLLNGAFQKAYDTYNSYYIRHHDDESVVKMASILYHKLKNPQKTIQLLETHSKMIGCGERVCVFLAELYRRNNDLESLASVYARLYDSTGATEYAQKAAEIYAYQKQFGKAVKLLESSGADDNLLLAIYKQTKTFDKAAKLAKRLYDETLDPVWLAEYGILLYEAAPKKDDPKLLAKVIRNLSKAFKEGVSDPLYYNYLGYLLIDHDIDVQWGIELVKKALKLEPDSAFYIDSLAWGHYKLGECKKAYSEMEKVIKKLGLEDEEIKSHWNKIQKCRSRKK
ncbi:tetratricopeptide repeat protein [Hydrogenimonas cancrithermarum]|uniref:Lipoprotein n=1 Tax=Hydrogenimonas cancrithermarum TaxID=2993563 RepID=A0ABN6WUN7_9BACT|nr:tetratricopeptide repeat protein [Hydrogenimonas cancrithermarum]BDY12017.1 lipoprotein [Hydrogenimonas cancrithermarum]